MNNDDIIEMENILDTKTYLNRIVSQRAQKKARMHLNGT